MDLEEIKNLFIKYGLDPSKAEIFEPCWNSRFTAREFRMTYRDRFDWPLNCLFLISNTELKAATDLDSLIRIRTESAVSELAKKLNNQA